MSNENTNTPAAASALREVVSLRGEELIIEPFTAKQFFEALKCLDWAMDKGMVVALDDAQGLLHDVDFRKVLLCAGQEVFEVLQIVTGREIAWLEALGVAEIVRLMAAVIRVNKAYYDAHAHELEEAVDPFLPYFRSPDDTPAAEQPPA